MSEQIPIDSEAVWSAFHDQLFGFVRRRVASDDDAEDIVQDVFARVHSRPTHGVGIKQIGAWLLQITRNLVADHHRARAKAGRIESALERQPEPDSSDDPLLDDASGELSRCLRPFVEQLPERYAQALSLVDLGGMSQADAARRLGLSASGMKSRVQRGRAQLRSLVLACCDVQLDARRRVVDYRRRASACDDCG